jgi:hydroxymethylpyrimidine pyrophosphatase-like HAD family hydrolase
MHILATDLDRTLLPNGPWPADPEAIALFNRLTDEHEILLVYVTGRNLALTEQAIREYGIRYPHVLCGDVGSTIRNCRGGRWEDDPGWERRVHAASPRWDAETVGGALAGIDGLRLQEPEHLNPFKLSYYLDHHRRGELLGLVQRALDPGFDAAVVYSFDSVKEIGLLDLLPDSATKLTALQYVAQEHGVPEEMVVFCGDSGNDVFALTAGFSGVLVKNADEQLVDAVRRAQSDRPELRVYFARGGFMGLNGNYTGGVIEGAHHYGLFQAPAAVTSPSDS